MIFRPSLIAIALLLSIPGLSSAHGGGLDSEGCHVESSTGDRHCHRGNQKSSDEISKAREKSSRSGRGEYDRDLYGSGWADSNGDCQDTRQEVLVDRGKRIGLTTNTCRVTQGVWVGPYTGKRYTDPSDLHIDHVVPLAEAHRSGARSWSSSKRRRFANDMYNLWAVDKGENMSKGAREPHNWLPEKNQCDYILRWIKVKNEWGLSFDRREESFLLDRVDACL